MRYTQRFRKGRGNRRENQTKRNLPRRRTVYKRRQLEKTRQRRNKKDGSMFKQTLKSAKELWQKVDDPLQQKKMFGGEITEEEVNSIIQTALSKINLKVTGDIEIGDIVGDLLRLKVVLNEYSTIINGENTNFVNATSSDAISNVVLNNFKNKLNTYSNSFNGYEKKEEINTKLSEIITSLEELIINHTNGTSSISSINNYIDYIIPIIVVDTAYNTKLTIVNGNLQNINVPVKEADEEKARSATDEAEKARSATDEAEKARLAAEEAEKARLATEEVEKARLATEEAEKARLETVVAEKARLETVVDNNKLPTILEETNNQTALNKIKEEIAKIEDFTKNNTDFFNGSVLLQEDLNSLKSLIESLGKMNISSDNEKIKIYKGLCEAIISRLSTYSLQELDNEKINNLKDYIQQIINNLDSFTVGES
jgi:DNA-binding protein Fis